MNKRICRVIAAASLAGSFVVTLTAGRAQATTITVDADQVCHTNSPYLTGACLEDVNHEIYGGIDSQMIFGESFAEPAPQLKFKGFTTFDGRWSLLPDGQIQGAGSDGAKMVGDAPPGSNAEVQVDLMLTDPADGGGGLIVKVRDPGDGADAFTGYEVSLVRPGFLVLGRHRQNWEPLRRVPCAAPVNQWIQLAVRMRGRGLDVLVNRKLMIRYQDNEHPLQAGAVGLRVWRQKVRFRQLEAGSPLSRQTLPFEYASGGDPVDRVSGMWRPIHEGDAIGRCSLATHEPFSGAQSQQITFSRGSGVIGLENQGLNRWGMNFIKGRSYEGYVWVRAASPAELFVALESRDGAAVYAEQALRVEAGGWQRLNFSLAPDTTDPAGRFAVELRQAGSVTLGYAFLQPGLWGRFDGLPVRQDVAEGLIHQGVTVLRYGGSMVNNPEYRWKKMIGPRAQRPPYPGHWYPYASNGWGIFDFLNFCEAADFLGIPDLDINESPRDFGDLMDYLNAGPDSEWGAKRVADGHPAPYRLKYIELGNEERVDDNYFEKFKAVAGVIWAKDPSIILIIGDFSYHQIITNPFAFGGADSGITTLAGQRKVLQLAKQHQREVWFDVHVWTDGPRVDPSLPGMLSYLDALDKIADGARHKALVFELNANNHTQRRAIANALALNVIQRDGRLPITCSANCLQPDGQNDNSWDQGLLFLNSSRTWLQPPGYVTKMYSENYQPVEVQTAVSGSRRELDVSSELSLDRGTLVLKVVNPGSQLVPASIRLHGYSPAHAAVAVEELAGSLDAVNTAANRRQIQPVSRRCQLEVDPNAAKPGLKYDFQPDSVTVLKFN